MINTYELKLTRLQQRIFRLLCVKAGMSLNQRGIARHLEVSQPAVMKALPGLEKESLIKIQQDKESKRWAVELNRDNHLVIGLKRADNLKMIYESGLNGCLGEQFAGATIILFGSYSRGDDIEKSDIDVAVIGRKEKSVDLAEFEKMLERAIRINFYPSFREIHKNLRENIYNGIVLAGSIEI